MFSPPLTQSLVCSHQLFKYFMEKRRITASEWSQRIDKTSCTDTDSMLPGVNLPPFSSCIGYYWERENLSDSPSIWVKHLSAGVCPGGCLIIYAAWNGYGKKDRAPVTAQWFVSHRRRRKLNCFKLQLRRKHQPLNCWVDVGSESSVNWGHIF